MNSVLPIKYVAESSVQSLEIGLRPSSEIINSIQCIGSNLNE